jgi:hypothetical protein
VGLQEKTMQKKKTTRRIQLNRETLLGLDGLSLAAAAQATAALCNTMNFTVCISNCPKCTAGCISPKPCSP